MLCDIVIASLCFQTTIAQPNLNTSIGRRSFSYNMVDGSVKLEFGGDVVRGNFQLPIKPIMGTGDCKPGGRGLVCSTSYRGSEEGYSTITIDADNLGAAQRIWHTIRWLDTNRPEKLDGF